MQNIPVVDCGDGRVRADTSYKKAPVAKTAAYTVLSSDSGTVFTNRGASGSVTFTLPTPTAGFKLQFLKAVNNQNIVITAAAASTMNGLTQGQTLTNSTSEYGTVSLEADGTAWFVVASTGTWAVS